MSDATHGVAVWFRDSVLVRVGLLGMLILVLQIPILWIYDLVGEREGSRQEAVVEVQESWGGAQLLEGPVLVVPYRSTDALWIDPYRAHAGVVHVFARPRELRIRSTMSPVVRTRGIFDVLLYRADVRFEATFARPDPEELGIPADAVIWDDVRIALPSRRRLPESVTIGGERAGLEPSSLEPFATASPPDPTAWPLEIAYDLEVAGGERLSFTGRAAVTHVELESSWPHPKFVGNHLPATRDVRTDGFTSTWDVTGPLGSRLEPWPSQGEAQHPSYGVELIQPVDAYRMVARSIKYEFLFTALTLGLFFLVEIFGRYRIHPIQYLMVGCALVLFYLLVLSLSEHITFSAAYAVAAAGVILLVTFYARAMFAAGGHTALVSMSLSLVYGFLFVLLALQDYSLLMGSLGLFVVLATIMFLTRDIDWYGGRVKLRA